VPRPGPLNLLLAFFLLVASFGNAFSQGWTFIKEKEGVYLYTHKEAGENLKSFKGVMEVRSTMSAVTNLISNPNNHDWWDENLTEIKVLQIENPKHFQYYLVYDVPWPLSDRDLVVDARVTVDPGSGKYVIFSTPLEGVVPEKPGMVRIKKYWQRWTVQPLGNGIIRITLEGFVDPAGNIPSWLYNMIITESPLKVMREVRKRVEAPVHG
jgi:hypothetical protein